MSEFKNFLEQRTEIALDILDDVAHFYQDDTEEEPFYWEEKVAKDHLEKRIKRGHLPSGSTMDCYNSVILDVLLTDPDIALHEKEHKYLFSKKDVKPNEDWIVVMTKDRYIETAFKTDKVGEYDEYIHKKKYHSVGNHFELSEKINAEETEN